jgi:predicted SAM-dependent methyltransferase
MNKNKLKLHLGCGNKHINGFINIDIRNLPEVDVVDDILKLNTIENETVDLIYVSHVLEHIGRHEYMNVLKKWFELLKVGGILRIAIPDFEKIVEHYNNNKNLKLLLYLGFQNIGT